MPKPLFDIEMLEDLEPHYYIEASPISFECWAHFIYALSLRPLDAFDYHPGLISCNIK